MKQRRSSNTSAYKIGELRKLASCGAMQLLRGADPVLRWSNGVASLLRKKTSLVGEVFRRKHSQRFDSLARQSTPDLLQKLRPKALIGF